MQCKDCSLWVQREIPKAKGDKTKKKEYYPAGWCLNAQYVEKRIAKLTVGETNCNANIH